MKCHKVIEDVEVGDLVWSYDEETDTSDWKPVVQLFRNTTSSWICTDIEVDGKIETIKSTAEHPYYVLNAEIDRQIVNFEGRDSESYNGQWVAAKDLKIGDKCLLSSGKTGIISKQEVEHLAEPETTYNFEVADFHTYYVGEQGILVHNACNTTEWVDNVDDALDRAGQHLGPEQSYYKGNNKIMVSKSDPTKVVRFDIDPLNPHVIKDGVHLNLETYAKPFGTPGQDPLKNIHLYWRK